MARELLRDEMRLPAILLPLLTESSSFLRLYLLLFWNSSTFRRAFKGYVTYTSGFDKVCGYGERVRDLGFEEGERL